jgi:glucose/mannose transport system substrate-binding protein
VKAPLATSKGFAQEMVLEVVLLAELGPDKFAGLWKGETDFNGADVTAALEKYKKLLSFSNVDREAIDWPDALGYVNKGTAAYTVMGDWVAAQQLADKVPDTAYTYWPAPGTQGVFQYLADSFTLPTNGKSPEGTKCWLKVVGSAEGQKAFNTRKGSIPARSDAVVTDYPKYQQAAMADWKKDKITPSCATVPRARSARTTASCPRSGSSAASRTSRPCRRPWPPPASPADRLPSTAGRPT